MGKFDELQGQPLEYFQLGRQTAGPNPLGIAIGQIMDRIGAIQSAKLQARLTGLTEEEKMKGMARFYTSPEGQQYSGAMSQMGAGMLNRVGGGAQAPSPQGPSTPSPDYTPQYGITGATFDPFNPVATKYQYGETPESQMRRGIAEDIGKKTSELGFATQVLQHHLGVIKEALGNVPPVASGSPFEAPLTTTAGWAKRRAGPLATRFRDVQSVIDATLGPFITAVEGISKGRLTQTELENLAHMIQDLPLLSGPDRARRFQLIDQVLFKGGVPTGFGGNASPQSPFQPTQSNSSPDIESVKNRLRAKYGMR